MICEVCAGAYERQGKRGPISRRCPACVAADKRRARRPKGRGFPPHACVGCGVETTRKFRCEPCADANGKAQREAWHKAHPELTHAAQARFRERHPERLTKRATMFGVSEVRFAAMLAAQGGRCAICGTDKPGDRGWNLDHDHQHAPRDPAGHRGALCRSCNLLLGHAQDQESILFAAIEYLRRHRAGKVRAA